MNISSKTLLATTALVGVLSTGAARAQTKPAENTLAEIVVTATKQSTAVSKVPLSIAVVTHEQIDQQGLQAPNDLARVTPGLNITPSNNPSGAQVTIRGKSVV